MNATLSEISEEAVKFIGLCYGISEGSTMSDKRYLMWIKKMRRKVIAPKLRSLPPTSEAFELHLLRAQYQCLLWKSCMNSDPPNIDPCNFGWKRDSISKSLQPIMLPPSTHAAPKDVLQTMACNCKSSEPCEKGNCSCKGSHIPCTVFCGCGVDCCNPYTNKKHEKDIEDNDEDSDNDDNEDDQN